MRNLRAPNNSSNSMVAFMVPEGDASSLVIDHPDAIRAEDLHVTLAFLGKAEDVDQQSLLRAVENFAGRSAPITVSLSGLIRFTKTDGDDAICYLVESPEISLFRGQLVAELEKEDILPANARNFVPHITVAYLGKDEPTPEIEVPDQEIRFSEISVTYGTELWSFPLRKENADDGDAQRSTPMETVFMRAAPAVGGKRAQMRLLRDKSLPVPFTASTPGKKDDGMDLRSGDWSLSRFMRYPVILFGHDFHGARALPIGLGQNTRIESGDLKIDVMYDEEDEFAQRCRRKAILGMMAGSVSWSRKGNKNELIEFSNVPVGLDPDSLPDIERAAARSVILDIADSLGEEESGDFFSAMSALRRSITEIVERGAVEDDPADAPEPAPVPQADTPNNGRALEFFDLADQVISGVRAIVQDWFHVVGFFSEGERNFVVISLNGRLWRYFYTVDSDKDEVVIGEGSRVKYAFQEVTAEEDDADGARMKKKEDEEEMRMDEDEEEVRMDMADEEEDEEDDPDGRSADGEGDPAADGGERNQMPDDLLADIFAKTELLVNKK